MPSTTRTLTLEEGDTIAEVSGFSRAPGRGSEHAHMAGWTESLGAATARGHAWGPHGDATTFAQRENSCRRGPGVEGAVLSHLSGNTSKEATVLCFHWVVPGKEEPGEGGRGDGGEERSRTYSRPGEQRRVRTEVAIGEGRRGSSGPREEGRRARSYYTS